MNSFQDQLPFDPRLRLNLPEWEPLLNDISKVDTFEKNNGTWFEQHYSKIDAVSGTISSQTQEPQVKKMLSVSTNDLRQVGLNKLLPNSDCGSVLESPDTGICLGSSHHLSPTFAPEDDLQSFVTVAKKCDMNDDSDISMDQENFQDEKQLSNIENQRDSGISEGSQLSPDSNIVPPLPKAFLNTTTPDTFSDCFRDMNDNASIWSSFHDNDTGPPNDNTTDTTPISEINQLHLQNRCHLDDSGNTSQQRLPCPKRNCPNCQTSTVLNMNETIVGNANFYDTIRLDSGCGEMMV